MKLEAMEPKLRMSVQFPVEKSTRLSLDKWKCKESLEKYEA